METNYQTPIKTDAEKLREALDSIPYGEYQTAIDRILNACQVRKSKFDNWRYGNTKEIPPLYKQVIEQTLNMVIF